MRKKFWIITAVCAIAVIFFILFAYTWVFNRLALVEHGLAKPNFPYFKYSIEELEKMYPQYIENNAPTVQSPEETHRKFVEALKKQDFDEAVKCCFREGDWEKMKEGLEEIKKKNELSQMIKDLDQTITKELMDDWKASYTYIIEKDEKKFGSSINFIKNSQGVWLIEFL